MTADNDNKTASDLETRRRKLKFRAWHRGMKEMDLLLGSYADRHIATMDEADLDRFEAMLHIPDQAFYSILVQDGEVPGEFDHALMHDVIDHARNPERRL